MQGQIACPFFSKAVRSPFKLKRLFGNSRYS